MSKLDPRRNFNPARRYRLRGKRAVAAVVSMCGLLVVGVPAVASLSATGASASGAPSANGESNKGDVWVDNVAASCTGSAASQDPEACESPNEGGPGHEQDPHLDCRNIDLWGNGLADASGEFTIDGWHPSGSGTGDFGKNPYNQDQAWPNAKSNPGIIGASPPGAAWNYEARGSDVIAVRAMSCWTSMMRSPAAIPR
jgi:hypothetical protein